MTRGASRGIGDVPQARLHEGLLEIPGRGRGHAEAFVVGHGAHLPTLPLSLLCTEVVKRHLTVRVGGWW